MIIARKIDEEVLDWSQVLENISLTRNFSYQILAILGSLVHIVAV